MQETRVLFLGQDDSPGEGNGKPLQYSCLGNPMDRGGLWFMGLQRVRHNLVTKQQQQKIQKSINAIHHMKTKEKKVFSFNTETFNNSQYEFVQIKLTKIMQEHVISRNFLKLTYGTNKKFLHSTSYLMVNDNAFPPKFGN